jgi:hypothetical protein
MMVPKWMKLHEFNVEKKTELLYLTMVLLNNIRGEIQLAKEINIVLKREKFCSEIKRV